MIKFAALLPVSAFLLAADGPSLFQQPAVNQTHIAFVYAGDLWRVDRRGGDAVRLTTGRGIEFNPMFSPDGRLLAFSGEYDGNVDVFVIPAEGGIPKRITSHPANDIVAGWSPDSRHILFSSTRQNIVPTSLAMRLFRVAASGGFPEALPLPTGSQAAFSPDGSQIAYLPLVRADTAWKRYRGGRATPIWIASLADSSVTPLPRKDSNDHAPMWIGSHIYFLSDRNGTATLFRYDTRSRQVTQLIENRGLELKWASAASDAIAYEQFGAIYLYDLKTGKAQPVNIRLNGDLPEVRPRMEKAAKWLRNAGLSPSGARAVFEARGEVLTVPAEKGDARNLTNTPGAAERYPAWSPDGKWIACFSDESGEYELHLRPQNGNGEIRKIALPKPSTFYTGPQWSPDSKKLAYQEKSGKLVWLDIDKQSFTTIDTDSSKPAWSPDSKWIAYEKELSNQLQAVHIYSLESGKPVQITDGMSDARWPVFDKGGKYLFFGASTDIGPAVNGIDMSTTHRRFTSTIYAAVLSKDEPSPLAPESDEEKPSSEKKDEKKPAAPLDVRIDFEGIQQRTIPLPLPARTYWGIEAGKAGILFVAELTSGGPHDGATGGFTVHRFDLSKRKAEKFLDGARAFQVSANGEKVLYQQGSNWFIAGSAAAPKPNDGRLKIDDIEFRIDPRAEWRQMYKEVLRLERDFFYDPGLHGLDIQALGERYEKYLANIASRTDLSYLWKEMLGELSVGHLYVMGGDAPEAPKVKGGLLGADYAIENGRYRITRIYSGENWNPTTRAPLTQPGVNVSTGDYILAVNGRELTASEEIYSYFEATAGKTVRLKISADPTGAASREVTVVPLESEAGLRQLAWIEENRRKVDQMSGGKIAYVYLPDTHSGGFTYFNRYYFAQADKQALVIDERYNGGGKAADYIIDYLRRPVWNYWTPRDGRDYTTPGLNITGPKAMIINESAGSGGDALPWYFRRAKLGPLVGKRTWGGLVGIGGTPQLIDGGMVTAPGFAFWTPEGKWEVENYGTPPDIEVELDPKAWRQGRDTQLEKAVEVVMEALKKNPPKQPTRPEYPNYHPKPQVTSGSR